MEGIGSWRVHEGFMEGTRRVHGDQRFMDAIEEALAVHTSNPWIQKNYDTKWKNMMHSCFAKQQFAKP
jgi:hypothetical protein